MTTLRPKRPTSSARAAAARANGAKSRGPVSIQGKANSSRNSFRHGFRARPPLFANPESQAALAASLETFERDFAPQSSIERALVQTMAVAAWRRSCLLKLGVSAFVLESGASARTLHDQAFSVAAFYRLDLLWAREHRRALDAWMKHCEAPKPVSCPLGRAVPASRNPGRTEIDERPPRTD